MNNIDPVYRFGTQKAHSWPIIVYCMALTSSLDGITTGTLHLFPFAHVMTSLHTVAAPAQVLLPLLDCHFHVKSLVFAK